eukprot:SAG22_NODE_2516_length_2488_cov_1.879029_3_plen_170_part_00
MPAQAHSKSGCRRPQNGREFLEDSPDLDAWLQVQLGAARRASTPQRKIKSAMYFEAFQSTGMNDSVTYADSRITNYLGHQVCYNLNATRPSDEPADWREEPAFYATLDNAYGRVLVQYIEKVFAMGFDGMCASNVLLLPLSPSVTLFPSSFTDSLSLSFCLSQLARRLC